MPRAETSEEEVTTDWVQVTVRGEDLIALRQAALEAAAAFFGVPANATTMIVGSVGAIPVITATDGRVVLYKSNVRVTYRPRVDPPAEDGGSNGADNARVTRPRRPAPSRRRESAPVRRGRAEYAADPDLSADDELDDEAEEA